MPEKLAVINASTGSYEDQDGKKRTRYQEIGALYRHTDGRCYLMMNAYFDFGRIAIKEGRDAFFLEVRTPENMRLKLVDREEL